jgi:hypothetical protein
MAKEVAVPKAQTRMAAKMVRQDRSHCCSREMDSVAPCRTAPDTEGGYEYACALLFSSDDDAAHIWAAPGCETFQAFVNFCAS